jgi:pyrimidine deaminase RibD-like protein
MDDFDRQMMELAVAEARKCQSDGTTPLVAAVAAMNRQLLGTAYRSQLHDGDHAEFTLLEKILPKDQILTGSTVYTTLEPCTKRGPKKTPCAHWLISRRVSRVVIGMWDPNPFISGNGCRQLREAGITVDVFPSDLMSVLEEINRNFIRTIKDDAIHKAVLEIGDLATQPRLKSRRAREAVALALGQCALELRLGQVIIPGREAGYFSRLLDCIEGAPEPESLKAYIRLTAFEPDDLHRKSSLQGAHQRLLDVVEQKKAEFDYVFLLRQEQLSEVEKCFIDGYKTLAKRIQILHPGHPWITPEIERPSIVLLENQKIAFTHDRNDKDGTLNKSTEWLFLEDYNRLHAQFKMLQSASAPYFER